MDEGTNAACGVIEEMRRKFQGNYQEIFLFLKKKRKRNCCELTIRDLRCVEREFRSADNSHYRKILKFFGVQINKTKSDNSDIFYPFSHLYFATE